MLLFSGMLGVPAKHKTQDLLQFTAPCHSELEMMRVIQYMDVPNQYMVLLRYKSLEVAVVILGVFVCLSAFKKSNHSSGFCSNSF